MILGELDQTDIDILNILQSDASMPGKDIAKLVNKSTAAVHERIRRLRSEGYINKIVAIVNKGKVRKRIMAFSQVLLHDHTDITLFNFQQAVIKYPEVLECHQMAGTYDFLLKIVTTDIDTYHKFYLEKLSKLPNIVTVQSFFVLSEAKNATSIHLEL